MYWKWNRYIFWRIKRKSIDFIHFGIHNRVKYILRAWNLIFSSIPVNIIEIKSQIWIDFSENKNKIVPNMPSLSDERVLYFEFVYSLFTNGFNILDSSNFGLISKWMVQYYKLYYGILNIFETSQSYWNY